LIAKKRPGTIAIINGQQALQLTDFIDQPQHAQRSFCTAPLMAASLKPTRSTAAMRRWLGFFTNRVINKN
jgi:hypothetical protein